MGIESSIVGSLRLRDATPPDRVPGLDLAAAARGTRTPVEKPAGMPLQAWLGDATAEAPTRFGAEVLRVGQRARLRRAVDRYPHFAVAAGAEGEVALVDGPLTCVRMDGHIEGAQEWGNCVQWYEDDPRGDLEVVRELDPTDPLVGEYERFAEREGLGLGCAREALAAGADLDGGTLTARQREWIAGFCERWEAVAADGGPVAFYNPQWGRCELVDRELHDRMSRDLFRPVHTGGGCAAWMRGSWEDHVLVTYADSDLGRWARAADPGWVAGRYVGEACGDVVEGELEAVLTAVPGLPDPTP